MSGGFNFFSWIREGVKDAVLLGVSDAVDQIGTPRDDDSLSQRLLETIRQPAAKLEGRPEAPGRARRLGRSLKDLESEADRKAG